VAQTDLVYIRILVSNGKIIALNSQDRQCGSIQELD